MAFDSTPLGQHTDYPTHYNPALLVPILRAETRSDLPASFGDCLNQSTGFQIHGADIWTLFECSWLLDNKVPRQAICTLIVPASSQWMVESKSLKLYLNSLNNHSFASDDDMLKTVTHDLDKALQTSVKLTIISKDHLDSLMPIAAMPSATLALDTLNVPLPNVASLDEAAGGLDDLVAEKSHVRSEKVVFTTCFRSVCPVTAQPDWATIWIESPVIKAIRDLTPLQAYLLAYRNQPGFHEHCVERIFSDVYQMFKKLASESTVELTVAGRFLRRGGIDINPWRSTNDQCPSYFQRILAQ